MKFLPRDQSVYYLHQLVVLVIYSFHSNHLSQSPFSLIFNSQVSLPQFCRLLYVLQMVERTIYEKPLHLRGKTMGFRQIVPQNDKGSEQDMLKLEVSAFGTASGLGRPGRFVFTSKRAR